MPSPSASAPADGFEVLEDGVQWRADRLTRDGRPLEVWLYRPDASPTPRPLVVIGPAGSNLLHGMALADGDRPEHLPYVRAGFHVVAYSIDGAVSPDADEAAFARSMQEFLQAEAGVADARAAIDHAAGELPVDSERIYAAGHSSAGTLALLVAAHDRRIDAVAAFAPVVDLVRYFHGQGLVDPELDQLLAQISPARFSEPLTRSRTFLFFAEDDRTIATEDVRALQGRLPDDGRHVLSTAPSGGHYAPMIDRGIPAAIEFFGAAD